jgi:dGTPase
MNIDLNKLFSIERTSTSKVTNDGDPRSAFQRDYDRIIFSSAFRRLQNKTQVFPLPGSVFVHNRLTHSLEVASVGRSLGKLIGQGIINEYKDLSPQSQEFFKYSLEIVVSSACLCHDIGNPAFGHSGEDAIANYFAKNTTGLKTHFNEAQWLDLINFEGNANAIRILTHQQTGRAEGGMGLTYSTLSAIAKYPCESTGKNGTSAHRKKFGFMQSEKEIFTAVATNTQMTLETSNPMVYYRHPFVWLVEAADDICYNIIDFEDAHRLGLVEHDKCISLLHDLVNCIGKDDISEIDAQISVIKDKNDKVAYLRAKSINALIMSCVDIYMHNVNDFLSGRFERSLFDVVKDDCNALQQIANFSIENIYNNRSVVEIENAGYNVMYELLSHFVPPIIKDSSSLLKSDKKAIRLIPPSFIYEGDDVYTKVLGVLDYISGMTDNYATDLYKRIKGIEIGMKI